MNGERENALVLLLEASEVSSDGLLMESQNERYQPRNSKRSNLLPLEVLHPLGVDLRQHAPANLLLLSSDLRRKLCYGSAIAVL